MSAAFSVQASNPVETAPKPPAKKKPTTSVVSLRVSTDERAAIEKNAAGLAMSEYLRERLLGDDVTPRRTRGRFPVKDHEALAKVLGLLGRSELAANVAALAWAAQQGTISPAPDFEAAVKQACTDIAEIRTILIRALGLKAS